jgi:hypothetical protein
VYVVGVPLGVAAGETLPHCAAEQITVHVTPLPAESLLTVAVNCAVRLGGRVAVEGVTPTTIGAVAVTEPEAHPPINKREESKNGKRSFIFTPHA